MKSITKITNPILPPFSLISLGWAFVSIFSDSFPTLLCPVPYCRERCPLGSLLGRCGGWEVLADGLRERDGKNWVTFWAASLEVAVSPLCSHLPPGSCTFHGGRSCYGSSSGHMALHAGFCSHNHLCCRLSHRGGSGFLLISISGGPH